MSGGDEASSHAVDGIPDANARSGLSAASASLDELRQEIASLERRLANLDPSESAPSISDLDSSDPGSLTENWRYDDEPDPERRSLVNPRLPRLDAFRPPRFILILVALAVGCFGWSFVESGDLSASPLVHWPGPLFGTDGTIVRLAAPTIMLFGLTLARTYVALGIAGIIGAGLLLPPPVIWTKVSGVGQDKIGHVVYRLGGSGTIGRVTLVIGSAIVGIFVKLVVDLWHGHYIWYDWWIEVIAIVVLLLFVAKLDREKGVRFRLDVNWLDVLAVGSAMIGFTAVSLATLVDWHFDVIGDEFEFFGLAKGIAYGIVVPNAFSQAGAYGYHPTLASMYQAAVMLLFGISGWSWKLSSFLIIVATLPFVYGFARQAFGQIAAVATVWMLAWSQSMLSWAHSGYDNIQPILPASVAIAAYWLGLNRRSRLFSVIAGLACALGFYTFYTSRLMIVLIGAQLAWLSWRQRDVFLNVARPFAVGFLALFLPFLAANKLTIITAMLDQSVIKPGGTLAGLVLTVLANTGKGFLVLLVYDGNVDGRYLTGGYVDTITGVLSLAGLIVAVRYARRPDLALVSGWYATAMLVAAGFSQHDGPVWTRQEFVVVPAVVLAGLALDGGLRALQSWLRGGRLRVAAVATPLVVGGLTLAAITRTNVERVFVEAPILHGARSEAVAFHAVSLPACHGPNAISATLVADHRDALIHFLVEAFSGGAAVPWLISQPEIDPPTFMQHRPCAVFTSDLTPELESFASQILTTNPGVVKQVVSDDAGGNSVLMLVNPHPEPLTADSLVGQLSPLPPRLLWLTGTVGTGPGQFDGPSGVAQRPDGSLVVADQRNRRLGLVSADGRSLGNLPMPTPSPGESGTPVDVAVGNDGRIVVADAEHGVVDVFDPNGHLLRSIAGGTRPLKTPNGVAFDGNGGLLIADTGNNRVVRATIDGGIVGEFEVPGKPLAVAPLPAHRVVVVGQEKRAVWIYDLQQPGHPIHEWTADGENPPWGTRVARVGDALFITSADMGAINVFDLGGEPIGSITRLENRPLLRPAGIAACGAFQLCLTEFDAGTVSEIQVTRLTQ